MKQTFYSYSDISKLSLLVMNICKIRNKEKKRDEAWGTNVVDLMDLTEVKKKSAICQSKQNPNPNALQLAVGPDTLATAFSCVRYISNSL